MSMTYGVHIHVSTMMIDHGASLTEPIISNEDGGMPVMNETA